MYVPAGLGTMRFMVLYTVCYAKNGVFAMNKKVTGANTRQCGEGTWIRRFSVFAKKNIFIYKFCCICDIMYVNVT